jgi:hypothetical protein
MRGFSAAVVTAARSLLPFYLSRLLFQFEFAGEEGGRISSPR